MVHMKQYLLNLRTLKMLKFTNTLKISNAIKDSLDQCNHASVVESFSKYLKETEQDEIPFYVLKQLVSVNPDLDLFHLLKGSHMILDKPQEVKKSKRLLEILKECQDVVDKREYQRMTKGLRRDVNDRFTDVKFTIGQVSSILNVILSMVAVFTVVMYFGDQVALGNISIKVLLALFCSWIVGIAEGYFLFKDLLQIQDQEEKVDAVGKYSS